MKLLKTILIIITLFLWISGCTEKDELAIPVKVHLKIGILEDPSEPNFAFSKGHIGIQTIQFEGIRESGGNIYFETDPEENFQTLGFGIKQLATISVYDIPQGIYYYMEWNISLKWIVTDELRYLDDAGSLDAGLVISGSYYPLGEGYGLPFVPIVIAIDDIEQLAVRAKDAENNSRIVLSENNIYEAIIWLDLSHAFQSISGDSIMEAEISGNGQDGVVLISSNKNKELYTIVLDRIFRSAKVIVK